MRDDLISEIKGHFGNSDFEPLFATHDHHEHDQPNELMTNDELENMTYEVFSGKHHVKGHMLNELESEGEEETNNLTSNAESAENLSYDVYSGSHHLQGSMLNNEADPSDQEEEGFDYMEHLLSLYQSGVTGESAAQHLDTNVMFDPATGEGLVCVNGRCISSKKKM